MAACLMLSGVGKSGSPAPKSTTSAPSRRRRSASAATFMVEETLMVEIRSAISAVACITYLLNLPLPRKFCLHPRHHARGDKAGDVASEAEDFPNHPRADKRMSFRRQQKQRFGFGPHAPVQQRHLHLC